MSIFRKIQKPFSVVLILLFSAIQLGSANAAMVSNDQILQQVQHDVSTQQILSLLEQVDVQNRLVEMGVNPQAAKERVESMTIAEQAELHAKLEELPAGEGVLGAVLVVFIVLVITDMLGATDVFPFVKNINK